MAGQGGFFELGRGVRQGCPLSPYIFILFVEVLATAIRRDNEIKGISVGNVECKISQFADDTTTILDGSQVSLERSFALLDSFGQLSGLRVNCEKTDRSSLDRIQDRFKSNYVPRKKLYMGKW